MTNFMIALSQQLELPPPGKEDVNQIIKDLDQNKDGKLSFEELKPTIIEIIKTLHNIEEIKQEEEMLEEESRLEQIRQIFMEIDTNNSGFIEWSELKNFMSLFSKMSNMEEPSEKQLK